MEAESFPPKLESISEDVDKLTWLLKRLEPATPVDETTEQPHQDPQGPSVIDSGKWVIEWRWAKETIGLVSIELNEAYAQFEINSDGYNIPTPHLHRATARLIEVMKRLGLAEYREIDSEIPF